MKTQTFISYSFCELSSQAKQKVLDYYRDINVEYSDWYEPIYEDWKEKLIKIGYYDIKISFTGFFSQGNGANFTGKIDIKDFIINNKLNSKYPELLRECTNEEIIAKLYKINNHYGHEDTISIEIDYSSENDKVNKQLNEMENIVLQTARDEMREIYKALNSFFDELRSDEMVVDTIEANEYQFTIDGDSKFIL